MNQEITIVTAFFDIKRENYTAIPRSVEQYFIYFERWARIKNDLVFFCENKSFGERVMSIREKFGLGNCTKIIYTNKLESIEPQLLQRMTEIENSEEFKRFRVNSELPENKAMYNFVMLMKFYCIKETAKFISGKLAWVDFGYEHGGDVFESAESYNFKWKYDFDDKITFFYKPPLCMTPMFAICRDMEPVCVMGALFVVASELAEVLWNLMLECEKEFADLGLMDDDQPFMLMAYRKNPKLFTMVASDWFMPIAEYGGPDAHFVKKPKSRISLIQRIKNKVKRILKWQK